MSASGALPTWQRQLPLAVVMGVVAAGLIVLTVVSDPVGYRVGLCLVAASLLMAAVLRAALPTRRIGLLAVRSRPFDVVILTGCAIAIAVLAVSLPPAA